MNLFQKELDYFNDKIINTKNEITFIQEEIKKNESDKYDLNSVLNNINRNIKILEYKKKNYRKSSKKIKFLKNIKKMTTTLIVLLLIALLGLLMGGLTTVSFFSFLIVAMSIKIGMDIWINNKIEKENKKCDKLSLQEIIKLLNNFNKDKREIQLNIFDLDKKINELNKKVIFLRKDLVIFENMYNVALETYENSLNIVDKNDHENVDEALNAEHKKVFINMTRKITNKQK